jgi:hypothetical protein
MKTTTKKFDIGKFEPPYDLLDYYSSKATFEDFWRGCERGDWMLWIAERLNIDKRLLAKAAAMCANTVQRLMDKRSVGAVNAALRYASGEIGVDELEKHANDAYAAHVAVDVAHAAANLAAHAAYAAFAAAHNAINLSAAHAATFAANAEAYAAYAAEGEAYAAAGAAAVAAAAAATAARAAAYAANQLQTANICREVLTEAVLEKVGQLQGEPATV